MILEKKMTEEIDEEDKIEVKQHDLIQKAFDNFCRDEHPYLVANGEKFKVVNLILNGKDIRLIALDDQTKHLEIDSIVTISEKDQKSIEMVVESHKLGMAWLKRK
jgi:hypothetical protein